MVAAWREKLQRGGVWANDPVPLYPYPSSPDYRRLWGAPDDQAWERAHAHYLAQFAAFSDIQDERPRRCRSSRRRAADEPTAASLMTTDAVGGVWTYALDLARGARSEGVTTVLAVLGPGARCGATAEAAAIPDLALRLMTAPLDWLAEQPAEVLAAGQALAALAAHEAARSRAAQQPARLRLARASHVPVLGVCHSCVATWWQAVRGSALPADFAWRDATAAPGLRGLRRLGRADAAPSPTRPRRSTDLPDRRTSSTTAGSRRPLQPRAGRASCSPPGGSGTRARMPRRSTAPRHVAAGARRRTGRRARTARRVALRGICASLDGSMRQAWRASSHAARSSSPSRATSLSAWRCWKPRRPAARWCCPTSRPSASSGTAPPSSFRRRMTPALGDAILGLLQDRERRAAFGKAARERARHYGVEEHDAGHAADPPRAPTGMVRRGEGQRHEARLFHPFAALLLEPRQRAFPARRAARTARCAATTCRRWNPSDAWSLENLLRDHGEAGLDAFRAAYPELHVARYTTADDDRCRA